MMNILKKNITNCTKKSSCHKISEKTDFLNNIKTNIEDGFHDLMDKMIMSESKDFIKESFDHLTDQGADLTYNTLDELVDDLFNFLKHKADEKFGTNNLITKSLKSAHNAIDSWGREQINKFDDRIDNNFNIVLETISGNIKNSTLYSDNLFFIPSNISNNNDDDLLPSGNIYNNYDHQ